jgi:ureidoglycolate hydrolase
MLGKQIIELPVQSTEDPSFNEIGRMVYLPETCPEKGIQFFPAFEGFATSTKGNELMDISYLYVPWHRDPLFEFDIHPDNEELFIILEGEFYMITGAGKSGGNPRLEDMHCYHLKQGDMFIQKRNVWHTACWPLDRRQEVKYLMILRGHRSIDENGAKLDHNIRRFCDNIAVIPDFSSVSSRR